MLSFRQFYTVAWACSAFVVAAAVALHLRYQPLEGGTAYLDSWTGKVHSAEALEGGPAEAAKELAQVMRMRIDVPDVVVPEVQVLPEALIEKRAHCGSVRFAFPAPDSPAWREMIRRRDRDR